jgi:hypothetical protein
MARPRKSTMKRTPVRVKKPCPHCGKPIGSNNMSTHIKMHVKNGTDTGKGAPAEAPVKDAPKADGTYTFVCSECDYKTNGPRGWAAHKRDEHPDATNVATEYNQRVHEAAGNGHKPTRSKRGVSHANAQNDDEIVFGRYIDALASSRSGDDRPRSYFEKRMEKAQLNFVRATGLAKAQVAQEITELQRELDARPDISELEEAFIKTGLVVAGTHEIEYGTLRVLGVPARVLKAAGIAR